MNYLTFPQKPLSIAIWGQGFAIETLKNIELLDEKEIYYWSDLDVQGFQMLSQIRSYYPQNQSLMMDFNIIEKYRQYVTKGTPTKTTLLPYLTKIEKEAFDFLKLNNYRLEQERISHSDLLITLSLQNT